MQEFKQLLAELDITNPQNIHAQTMPPEITTQAFAESQAQFSEIYASLSAQDRPSNHPQTPPGLREIQQIWEEVLTGDRDAWDHFERLESQSKHFSLQVSKQNPNILMASSLSPLSVLDARHLLFHDDQIAVFEADQTSLQIITTETHALTLLFQGSRFYTYETELSPIPRFQTDSPPWLISSLQKQDQLIERAIAFGDISRFTEAQISIKKRSVEDFLSQLQTPRPQFQWQNIHPIQRRIIGNHLKQWIVELRNQARQLSSETDTIEQKISEWLQDRDRLQSLLCVAQYYISTEELEERITALDASFPHAKTSHFLPRSHRLAEAFSMDPACWWGKSSKMRALYDQLSSTQS